MDDFQDRTGHKTEDLTQIAKKRKNPEPMQIVQLGHKCRHRTLANIIIQGIIL
jgi:hypothetical protein